MLTVPIQGRFPVKIDSSFSPARPATAQGKDAPLRAQPGQSAAQAESPSSVTHLSAAGSRSASQDIDPARVAELREAIREGRFAINAERIADGLIESVREQLGLT